MNINQMKKIFLTSALAMSMLSPAMADVDIAAGANTADCDSDVLKTTSGSANLEANWDPNTITLNWYAGSDSDTPLTVQTGAQTCTYDGNITLPTTQPTKPGYTFDHWAVRQLFDLSTLNTSINPTEIRYLRTDNGAPYCEGGYVNSEGDIDDEDWYGMYEGNADCSDSRFAGMATNEWRDIFSYGTVKGEWKCSAKSGNNHSYNWGGNSADWTATESELTSAGDGGYCWCKPTGFDAENDGTFVGVASPSWVVYNVFGSASDCAGDCASDCADRVQRDSTFRAALYGVTQ